MPWRRRATPGRRGRRRRPSPARGRCRQNVQLDRCRRRRRTCVHPARVDSCHCMSFTGQGRRTTGNALERMHTDLMAARTHARVCCVRPPSFSRAQHDAGTGTGAHPSPLGMAAVTGQGRPVPHSRGEPGCSQSGGVHACRARRDRQGLVYIRLRQGRVAHYFATRLKRCDLAVVRG